MAVTVVNNQNQHEQAGDYRSRPRWSAGKKTDAVLRLLERRAAGDTAARARSGGAPAGGLAG
jgi:hypothetical protein